LEEVWRDNDSVEGLVDGMRVVFEGRERRTLDIEAGPLLQTLNIAVNQKINKPVGIRSIK
tara:strand:- start:631 stop:810 length:180 start_codon:yes stop_codon:yes gene_type:complete